MRDKLNGLNAKYFALAWIALTLAGTGINSSSGKTIYGPGSNLFGDLLGDFGFICLLIALFLASYHRYSEKKEHHEKTRIAKAFTITAGILVFLAAATISGAIVSGLLSKGSSSSNPTDLASQAAQAAKSSYNLPYEVDSVTTLNDITSSGNTVQYQYTIHDADTSNVSNDTLESSIKPNVCANTSTKQLLDSGVNMQYNYTVKESGAQYSFTIAQSDC